MASLLSLPDEIKIHIFGYLDGVDKIELLKVCRDLQRVGVDRDVLQCMNFTQNYRLTLSQLRYIARKQTASKVIHLNLNGVHWIPSAQLRDIIAKFTKLTALYVLDTQLSLNHLAKTLETTTKVRKLAFSLKPDSCADVFRVQIPLPITHLFVTYNSNAMRVFFRLLIQFRKLEELWLVERRRPVQSTNQQENSWLHYSEVTVPKVSKKIVFVRQSGQSRHEKYFVESLRDPKTKWFSLVKINKECILYVAEDFNAPIVKTHGLDSGRFCKDRIMEKVEKHGLEFTINEDVTTFDVLNAGNLHWLFRCDASLINHNLISNATSWIRKMNCDSKIFWDDIQEIEKAEVTALFKKRRVGLRSQEPNENCKFAQFTNRATEMEEFEIIDKDTRSVRNSKWRIDNLTFARNWKILKKLTITSVNIHKSTFIIDITKNCTMLSCLKIHDDMIQDNLSSNLCEALNYASNLKDFRYERKGAIPLDQLLESLSKCLKLERLYLQCRCACKIGKKPLQSVITNCKNLIFLFIFISELSDTVCKSIKQSISDFGVNPQQIISFRGQSYSLSNIMYEDIPYCHVEEMVLQENNLDSDYLRSFCYC